MRPLVVLGRVHAQGRRAGRGRDDDDLYATLTWLEKVRDHVEVAIFERLRKRSVLDAAAFFDDTTARWFEGRGPAELAEFGRPKGGQPCDRRSILVGLVRTREGWPITQRVFPGTTADLSTFQARVGDLQERFGEKRFVFVGDRGTVGEEVIADLEARGLQYVLATRLRWSKEVRDRVLRRAGRYRVVAENLEVKDVSVDGRRYLVCRNPRAMARDAQRPEDILARLRTALGDNGLAIDSWQAATVRANRSFARHVEVERGRLAISQPKVSEDARYDGKRVIRTNVEDENSVALAQTYKHLGGIERDFRDLKSFIELRAVYHSTEPRVRAHVFVCVLAELLMAEIQRCILEGNLSTTLPGALRALRTVKVSKLETGLDKRGMRSDLDADVRELLAALQIPEAALRVPSGV